MVEESQEPMRLRTPGGGAYGAMGRAWQRHRDGSSAFFAEYLETTGLFQRWLESCPLSYTSPSW
jgi:hypothetical protein